MTRSTACTFFVLALALAGAPVRGAEPTLLDVLCDEPGSDGVGGVSYSADGKLLLTAEPNQARVWEAATGKLKAVLRRENSGNSRPFLAAILSPDGATVATLVGCQLQLWDVASGRPRELPVDPFEVTACIAYRPDGKALAGGGGDTNGTVRIWDAAGKPTAVLRGHTRPVWAVAFSSDGRALATASMDRTVRVWDVETGKTTATWELPGWEPMANALAFSPNGKRVAAGGSDPTIRVWEVATGRLTTLAQAGSWVTAVAYSPDGKTLAAGEVSVRKEDLVDGIGGPQSAGIRLWDVEAGRAVATLRRPATRCAHWPIRLAFSPDGGTLAAAVTAPMFGGWVERWARAVEPTARRTEPAGPAVDKASGPADPLDRARAAASTYQVADARRLFEEAAARARTDRDRDPAAGGPALAAVLRQYGEYLGALRLFAEAEAALAEAGRALPRGDAGDEQAAIAGARSRWLESAGRRADALAWAGEEYRLRRDLARSEAADTTRKERWLRAGDRYAHALFDQGRDGPAEAVLGECLKAVSERRGDARLVGLLSNTWALVLKETGRWEDADRAYTAAIDAHRRALAAAPDSVEARRSLVSVLRNRSLVRDQLEQTDPGRRDRDEAGELERAIPPAKEQDRFWRDAERAIQLTSALLPIPDGLPDPAALAAVRKRAADQPDVPAFQLDLLTAEAVAVVQPEPGTDPDRADVAVRDLRDRAAALARRYPNVPAYKALAPSYQFFLAFRRVERGQPGADAQVAAALAEFDKLADDRPDDISARRMAANMHVHAAMAYMQLERGGEAVPELAAGLAHHRRVAAACPESVQFARAVAVAGQNLGMTLFGTRKWAEAEVALNENVDPWRELARKRPDIVAFPDQLARTYEYLACVLEEQKKTADARSAADKSRVLREQVAKAVPGDRRYGHRLGQAHALDGRLRAHADDQAGAAAAYGQAVDLLEGMLKADPADGQARADLIEALRNRGSAYSAAGRYVEFSRDFDRAAAVGRERP